MKQTQQVTSIGKMLCVAAMTLALGEAAHASALRTFVSGAGNDSNTSTNCARPTPCRTLANALTVTTAGGEIDALDPAGYGPITINSSLTLVGVPGASISAPSGGIGVTVNGGTVIVENFEITGGGASNTTGVSIVTGNLILENSALRFLTTGITVAANIKSDVENTNISNNTTGISTNGTGTDFDSFTTYGPTQLRIFGGSVVGNTTAFLMNSPGNDEYQVFPTILIADPQTTNTAGNATFVACTGINAISNQTPPCNFVGQYGLTTQSSNQVH